jgi:hypothetical protein
MIFATVSAGVRVVGDDGERAASGRPGRLGVFEDLGGHDVVERLDLRGGQVRLQQLRGGDGLVIEGGDPARGSWRFALRSRSPHSRHPLHRGSLRKRAWLSLPSAKLPVRHGLGHGKGEK